MAKNKGMIWIIAIVLLVVSLKFGVFSGSIFSSDPTYLPYSLDSSSWTRSNTENIYDYCSPSTTRMDHHPAGYAACTGFISPYLTGNTIWQTCTSGFCPDLRTDKIGIETIYPESGNAGGAWTVEVTDGTNSVIVWSASGSTNYFGNPQGRQDAYLEYSGSVLKFNSTLPPGYTTRQLVTYSAASLNPAQPWRLKMTDTKITSSGSEYTYLVMGGLYKKILAPSAPTGLTVTGSTVTGISISWTASAGADTYNVYLDGAGSPSLLGVTGTSTTVAPLNPNTAYTLEVTAVNAGGESSKSNSVPGSTLPELFTTQPQIIGSTSVQTGNSYTYTVSPLAVINSGHALDYKISWGDGTDTGWVSSTSSSHSWAATGVKSVTIQARCRTHTTTLSNTNTLAVSVSNPTCDTSHIQGELILPTYCVGNLVKQKYWDCQGTSWVQSEQTNQDCTLTSQTCSSGVCTTPSPPSGGGGSSGGSSKTVVQTPAVTQPVEEPKNNTRTIILVILGAGAIYLLTRKKK